MAAAQPYSVPKTEHRDSATRGYHLSWFQPGQRVCPSEAEKGVRLLPAGQAYDSVPQTYPEVVRPVAPVPQFLAGFSLNRGFR